MSKFSYEQLTQAPIEVLEKVFKGRKRIEVLKRAKLRSNERIKNAEVQIKAADREIEQIEDLMKKLKLT